MAGFCGHWHLHGYGPFAVEEKALGHFIGYCGPWFPHGKPEQEIMWGILPTAQRKGYPVEAALAARSWAYKKLGWVTAVSYIDPDNIGSRAVAHRLGAVASETIYYDAFVVQVWHHPQSETFSGNAGVA